jgi:hypothetical protein
MTLTDDDDHRLASAFEDLRREVATMETPQHVQTAVLAAWDNAHRHTTAIPRGRWRELAAVAAAVTIATCLTQLARQLDRLAQPASKELVDSRTLLLVGEPILQGEPVRMVRMRVPVSTLAGLGVRPITGTPAEHIDVDVIVGEDGVARAIRVGR